MILTWSNCTTAFFTTLAIGLYLHATRFDRAPWLIAAGALYGLAVQTHPSAFALALPILRPPSALATMARLTDDTYTYPGKNGGQNVLKLQGATSPLKPFIKFDLSTLPAGTTGADVEKAT